MWLYMVKFKPALVVELLEKKIRVFFYEILLLRHKHSIYTKLVVIILIGMIFKFKNAKESQIWICLFTIVEYFDEN